MSKIKTARNIYSNEGVMRLLYYGIEYSYYKLPFVSKKVYQSGKYENTKQRWKIIKQHLTEEDELLLDIGCNAGMFVSRAAESGLLSLGIDRFQDRYRNSARIASQIFEEKHNSGFINMSVTPENINLLPAADVVLLLSVYHHWYAEFGSEQAKEMLSALKGTEKLFFEPPSRASFYVSGSTDENASPPPIEDFDKESIVEFNVALLNSALGEQYSIELVGATGEKVERYIFLASKN